MSTGTYQVSPRKYVKAYLNREIYAMSEAYLEPCQTSKMEHFAKIINGFQRLLFWGFVILSSKISAGNEVVDVYCVKDYVI